MSYANPESSLTTEQLNKVADSDHDTADAVDAALANTIPADGPFGANGATPLTQEQAEVTGSTGGNAALQSLLTVLESLGLITDSTS